METRRQALIAELERTKERQASNLAENKRLSERIVEMEKRSASLELELNAMTSKYEREKRAHQETEQSRSGNQEEASAEVVKALQLKLQEEKASRQRAENQWQERERQISMLSVDYRQIQQQLNKLEGDHRQVREPIFARLLHKCQHGPCAKLTGSGQDERTHLAIGARVTEKVTPAERPERSVCRNGHSSKSGAPATA